jgi:hypothetical protein
VVLASLGAPAFMGCSSKDDRTEVESVGTLNLNLTGTSSSGNHYRLRNAFFQVNGPDDVVLFSENDVNAASIRQLLAVGSYIVELVDGWSLERRHAGRFEPVSAALTSVNPAGFAIQEQGVTGVVFQFKAGDDVIELGHGVLELSIDVEDEGCQDGDVLCGSTCTELSSDSSNCGACGVSCDEGEICSGGECSSNIFSDAFSQDQDSPAQCSRWNAFRSSIGAGPFSSITLRGSQDGVGQTCTGAEAQNLCDALRDGLAFSTFCDGLPWHVGSCGNGVELTTTGSVCACNFGYTARPCSNGGSWGGIDGDTCGARSQTIEVLCH